MAKLGPLFIQVVDVLVPVLILSTIGYFRIRFETSDRNL